MWNMHTARISISLQSKKLGGQIIPGSAMEQRTHPLVHATDTLSVVVSHSFSSFFFLISVSWEFTYRYGAQEGASQPCQNDV